METAGRTAVQTRARGRSRWARRLGTLLIVLGLCVLAWTLVVWQWNDPFTSLYTRWQQRQLESDYAALVEREASRPTPPAAAAKPSAPAPDPAVAIANAAKRFRMSATEGSAIGRLAIPRLGVDMVIVNGTETDTLKKGPGRYLGTSMPGEGELVYIAGHRTTYGAPFAKIDELRPGDRFTLEMPYATFTYEVTGHRIVDDEDLSVLESKGREQVALQACHPRFFATQRYIVWAKPLSAAPRH
jgi:sortase A